ncbi:hypothetical protein E2C01_068130 [Portunus trituberculatus]|uniref:Uncharacterized protein n=1 Tax=Portunus trituberculatus TaxID=210409 RepID=A0A5B7HUZ4_PORTR|nr:hypothetical protein [Portunus trituberculatus]
MQLGGRRGLAGGGPLPGRGHHRCQHSPPHRADDFVQLSILRKRRSVPEFKLFSDSVQKGKGAASLCTQYLSGLPCEILFFGSGAPSRGRGGRRAGVAGFAKR